MAKSGWLVVNAFYKSEKTEEIHQWLLDAAKHAEICLQLKTNEDLMCVLNVSDGVPSFLKETTYPDFVLFWDKDVRLAKCLELAGLRVFNRSSAIAACDDKSLTHLLMHSAGIPMPRTILAPLTFFNIGYQQLSFLQTVSDQLGFPLVVKECFGSFGQQVFLANTMEELEAVALSIGVRPFLFQEFIASSSGRDLRLQVVGRRVIAAMERRSENGDFRANVTLGGSMRAHTPTEREEKLALDVCDRLQLDFAGVDLLFASDGTPVVCEVNSNAHFKNIHDCTGINAATAIIQHLLQEISI